MKLPPSNLSPRVALWTFVLALGVALIPSLRAQLSKYVKIKGFKFVEYYEALPGLREQTNLFKNRLTGTEGQYLTNGLVRITSSRLESYPPRAESTNLIAESPVSFFDLDNHFVSSTGALHLIAADARLTVRGWSGYQFSMTNNHFVVSNRVRGFLRESLFKSQSP